MMDYSTLQRQWDLIPKEVYGATITIIGAGAVGSWTALALAKMGFTNLSVWDNDDVSVENMNNQFYPISAIGRKKVVALQEMVEHFTGAKISVNPERYGNQELSTDLVISAVDSMEVRKTIFNRLGYSVKWFIDPRMGAENILVYTFKPRDPSYLDSWYSDNDSVHERCTAKSTIYCANVISGLVCKVVKNLVCKQNYPFNITYDMISNDFKSWTRKA